MVDQARRDYQIAAVALQVGRLDLQGHGDQVGLLQQGPQVVERVGRRIQQRHGGGSVAGGQAGDEGEEGGGGIPLCRGEGWTKGMQPSLVLSGGMLDGKHGVFRKHGVRRL